MTFTSFKLASILMLTSHIFYGQQSITGKIISEDNKPIIGATISLFSLDSTLIQGAITDLNGGFILKEIKANTYNIKVSFTGMKSYEKRIELTESIQFEEIILIENSELLKSLKVEGTQALAIQKGDTTEYDANAFKTNIDASTGDLLDKIPGVSVDGGTITADGEEVKKVLIDGKPFFGDDTKAAIENIPADAVSKVQVLDDKSEDSKFTGINDGQKEKTINIVTKESFRNSIFGDVVAGIGHKEKYNIGGNANVFNDKRKVSVYGFSNNINREGGSSISSIDKGWNSPTSGLNHLIGYDENAGIYSYNALGLNWVEIFKKGQATITYAFLNQNKDFEQITHRNYFIDSAFQYDKNEIKNANKNGHLIGFRLKYKLTKKLSLSFTNNSTISNGINNGIIESKIIADTSSSILNNITKEKYNKFNSTNHLNFRYKIDTNNRSISIGGKAFLYKENNNSIYNNNLIGNNTISNLLLDRSDNEDDDKYGYWIRYTNPLGKKNTVSIKYYENFNIKSINSEALDRTINNEGIPSDSLAINTKNNQKEQVVSLAFNLNSKKGSYLYSSLSYNHISFLNNQLLPNETSTERKYHNFTNSMYGKWVINDQNNFGISSYQSTNQPEIDQLQQNINNNDLLNITLGNTSLNQEYSLFNNIRFKHSNKDKTATLSVSGNTFIILNHIATISTIAEENTTINGYNINKGAIVNTYENLSGKYAYGGRIDYSFAWGAIKSKVNIGAHFDFNQIPTIILNEKRFSYEKQIGMNYKLSSNISKKIDFTIKFKPSLRNITNSTNESENSYFTYPIQGKLSYDAPLDFVFKLNYNGNINNGFEQNINYHLLSFSIGKRIFKNKQGKIQLEVFDAFNQNNSIEVNASPNFTEEVQTNILQRFVMLSFTYKIRAKNKKKKAEGFPAGMQIMGL